MGYDLAGKPDAVRLIWRTLIARITGAANQRRRVLFERRAMAWSQIKGSGRTVRAFKPGVLVQGLENNSYSDPKTGESFDSRDVFIEHDRSWNIQPFYSPIHHERVK